MCIVKPDIHTEYIVIHLYITHIPSLCFGVLVFVSCGISEIVADVIRTIAWGGRPPVDGELDGKLRE